MNADNPGGLLVALDVTAHLSPREREIAKAICEGLTNRQIAERLLISPHTVKHHIDNILAKLGCHHRSQIAAIFSQRDSARLARQSAELAG